MFNLNNTFVTSDHHFRAWAHFGGLLCESSQEQEEEHIALWNSVVGNGDLVLYVGWKPITLAEAFRQMDAVVAGGREDAMQHE